jgi:uncharacterized protein with von Willebrand factor type A (vWA) domain
MEAKHERRENKGLDKGDRSDCGSMNFATKEEMNRRFTEMKQEMSHRFDKVERQLERMNQNFIDHLRDHNNPDRDPIRYFYEFCHKRRNES